jgi:hypothetical protein
MKPLHDEQINWENVEHPTYPKKHENPAIQYELMQEQDLLQKLGNLDFVSVDPDTKADLQVNYRDQLERVRLNIQQLAEPIQQD